MDDEKEKFSEAEMVIGGVFVVGVDAACALIDLTVAGAAVSPVIQSFTTFGISMWAQSKGAILSVGPEIAKYASNVLPVVPTVTLIFSITVGLQNEWFGKTVSEAAEKAGSMGKTSTSSLSKIKK